MKKKNKRVTAGFAIGAAAVLTILVLLIVFYRQNAESEPYRVICIPKAVDSSNGFWTSLIDGVELAAEELDVELTISGEESEENVEGQVERILAAIEEKPDAIIVAPTDYENSGEILRQIVDADIHLILVDCVVDEEIGDSIVATDNYDAGKQLGAYAASLIDDDTQIGLVCHVQATSTAIEREEGIRAGLGSLSDNIVSVVYGNSDYDESYEQTVKMLEENPEITCIFGTNEYSAVGAARALKDLGLEDQIQMFGIDNSVEEVQLLEEGIIKGIVIQKPFNMGYLAMQQAVLAITGKTVDADINTGSKLITMDNLYEEENQRLLYSFSEEKE